MSSVVLTLIASMSLLAPATADAPQPDPRESLETAIPEAIRLLEAKQYKELILKFAPPEALKGEEDDFNEHLAEFSKRGAGILLKVLKEIRGTKPELNEDGTRATFKLKEKIESRNAIIFEKIGKYWYIRN